MAPLLLALLSLWPTASPQRVGDAFAGACARVPMLTGGEFAAWLGKIDAARMIKDKLLAVDTLATKRGLTAWQLEQILARLPLGTDRHNVAAQLFPYVVDKERWRNTIEWMNDGTAVPLLRRYAEVPDRIVVDEASGTGVMVVGPVAIVPGVPTAPVVCLALTAISEPEVEALRRAIAAERGAEQLRLLQAGVKHHLFRSKQILALVTAFAYRAERVEAANLLKPRVLDAGQWESTICALLRDWTDCAL